MIQKLKQEGPMSRLIAVSIAFLLCLNLAAINLSAQTDEEEEASTNVTLDFKDADINNVLRILSLKSGINIVAGPEVQGTVTIRLSDVPWERALEVVLRTYGYVYEREGNIIRVTTRERVEQEDLVTDTFVLNYITADEVKDAIEEILSERGKIKAFTRTNTIIVTDVASNIFKISQVVKRLDKPTPQAYIDSRVVRTELGETENLGIDWNVDGGLTAGSYRPTTFPFAVPGGGKKAPYILGGEFQQFFPTVGGATTTSGTTATNTAAANTFDPKEFPFPNAQITNQDFKFGRLDFTNFSSVLNLIKNRSNTKIVSNPRIVVLNNQTAKVQVGQQVGIPTFERNETSGSFEVTGFTMKDVGVVLNVTPHINAADEIMVDLRPEVSSFDGFNQIGTTNLSAPQFTITQAVTQVLIKDGETIAIGGLLTDSETTSEDKIPFFGDIPGIGKLFRSKRQQAGSGNRKIETLFFVTVSVVDSEGQPTAQFTAAKP
jgi:type IV pilus assembly protein PilQ